MPFFLFDKRRWGTILVEETFSIFDFSIDNSINLKPSGVL